MVRKTTIAIFFSVLIPGFGQAYLGQVLRGVAILLFGASIAMTLYYFFGAIGAMLTSVYWSWNIVDVYLLGKRISQGENKTKSKLCTSCEGSGAVRTGSSMGSTYAPSLSFTRCPLCGGSGSLPDT